MIILAAMAGLWQGALGPQSTLSNSFRDLKDRSGEAARTEMASLGVNVLDAGATVEFSVRNDGQTSLRGWELWDLFITYQDSPGSGLQVKRPTYTSEATPAAGEWTVQGIYETAATLDPEFHEPGIVNPSEEIILIASVSPVIAAGTSNAITLAVANGTVVEDTFAN